ncbi:hypothetical protein [Paenibacillus sp. MMS18-CY102]|uniref:hypothetical protein n=1 Tax=Paenibacillus sp. MMS18-CY102 TaxID=2682849 RepID=UPI0013651AC8|nr:hypothetical protein [Paenibacillus sp. MMS18-CY102]MWC28978.1 hypothetical protein [Paenibacillus sp. MMS18-CY102]
MTANILPIYEPIIHGRMYYAFPLCLIDASDRHAQSWIMSRFVQLQSHTLAQVEQTGIAELRFANADHPACYTDAFEVEQVSMDGMTQSDITSYIRKAITLHQYAYIYVDKFYVADNPFSAKKHVVQESLIYGDEDGKFHILGFNRNRRFDKSVVSHSDIAHGFLNSATSSIYFLRPKAFHQSAFDLMDSREQLNQYLLSQNANVDYVGEPRHERAFGLQVYASLQQSIRNLADRKELAVPNIAYLHILAEHKKLMHKRLQGFHGHGVALASESMLQYQAYEKQLMKLRNDLIKYEANHKVAILQQIDDSLRIIAQSEKQCLMGFLDCIPC